jgi:hypothetical protein
LPSQIEGGLRRAGAPSVVVELWSRIGNVAGAITGSVPGLFCMPQATSIPSEIGEAVRRTATRRCEEEREHTRRTVNGRDAWPDPDHPDDTNRTVPRFDMGACRQRVSDDRENPLSQMPNAAQPQDARPAKVWDYASNGNLFMQSWAAVLKPKTMLDRDDEGLEIADQQRTGSLVEMHDDGLLDGLTWAQAEMFFDCGGHWDSETCRTDAMWAIRWKARLRRIQDLRSMAGQAAAGIVVESIVSGLYRVMGDLTERYVQRGFALPDILNMNLRDVWYTNEYLRTRARRWAYGTSGYEAGERVLRGDPTRRTLIH